MAPDLHAVRQRDVVADATIVAEMTVSHKVAAVTDAGDAAALSAAGGHGDAFADDVVGTDDEASLRCLRVADLSLAAQHRLRMHHRSEEHTSELQSRFGISYAVFC